MHKLKNKHTGEVIATPYMAEVEEYLKSGDYEMSKNKYPAIFQPDYDSEIKVLVYGQYDGVNAIHLDGKHKGAKTKYTIHGSLKNITREYLTNTYGKCESQEHADFIYKLALNAGFELNHDYIDGECFYIAYEKVGFASKGFCSSGGAKLINLPLPPSKKEIPSTQVIESEQVSQFPKMEVNTPMPQVKSPKQGKPVYTKEMKKNGDIEVGMIYLNEDNQKCELIGINGKSFIGRFTELTVHYSHLDISSIDECKPIPTIEDELSEIWESEPDKHSIINAIIEKYNITPKEK